MAFLAMATKTRPVMGDACTEVGMETWNRRLAPAARAAQNWQKMQNEAKRKRRIVMGLSITHYDPWLAIAGKARF
jgi:hypothetical protein